LKRVKDLADNKQHISLTSLKVVVDTNGVQTLTSNSRSTAKSTLRP